MKNENKTEPRADDKRKNDIDKKIDFHIPQQCCPEQYPSPKLPSPTSCLPEETLEKVIEKIRAANELLLDLALGEERLPDETYQKVFDGLIGLQVEITSLSGEAYEGEVALSGFDFVVLSNEEKVFIYPYSEIDVVKPFGRFADPYEDPELREIDSCFRRELTFHFGDVVSSSPELIHLFFRMRLNIYLLVFEEKHIQIQIEGQTIEGQMKRVDKESISLEVDGHLTTISIDKIQLFTLNN